MSKTSLSSDKIPDTLSATNGATILTDLQARGLVYQATNGLAEHLSQPRTLYCGFDPTADSLHIGSLVPLLTLRRFQNAGHTPIILVGGATGLIGDPSFKAQERKLNTEDTVHGWVAKLQKQTSRFVQFEGIGNQARMANNFDWTHGVSILTFLRDVGKFFSVNSMIAKEAVKSRLEREDSGISFTEFSYALLQAFDFLHLYKNETCTVQLGASDQFGNITAGTELIHKAAQGQGFGLTLPLLLKSDGTKFGKTESHTLWLDAAKTSPYAFHQFLLNVADDDVARFLKIFSFQSVADIDNLVESHQADPGKRLAQHALADELTETVHGPDAVTAAKRIAAALFGTGLNDLTTDDYAQLAQDGLPVMQFTTETTVTDALMATGLAASKREARQFLAGLAIRHQGQVVTEDTTLTPANAVFGKYHLLQRGKKLHALAVHS